MKLLPLSLAALLCSAAPLLAAPPYTVSKIVPLGAPDRWDYLSFDAASNRVFVAHGDHTDVVDATSGAVLGKLAGLQGAHGQTVAADGDIYADSGKSGEVTAYDAKTMAARKTLPAGQDADGVIYEPAHKLVVVIDGDGEALTLIDSATQSVKGTVKLGGSPEFGAADGRGMVYIAMASTREIAKVDAGAGKIVGRFAIPGCESPHGLAMDAATGRVFVSCENAVLVSVDAVSGKTLQSLPIGHGTDAAAFDPTRRLVYSANGEGTLSVLREAADGTLTALGDVKTMAGARTLAVDPRSGRVFLVTADVAGPRADRPGRFTFKPGTVKLVFLDPQ